MVSPTPQIRRCDRMVVKARYGEVLVRELRRRTARALEPQPLNPAEADRTPAAAEVAWIARIVWATQ